MNVLKELGFVAVAKSVKEWIKEGLKVYSGMYWTGVFIGIGYLGMKAGCRASIFVANSAAKAFKVVKEKIQNRKPVDADATANAQPEETQE
ncbi:MAG: hypothetical protein J6Y20_05530 [Lachnospiraceae bacterium]|nr:hypothetical protein [Lachnospiraceae bacterium]